MAGAAHIVEDRRHVPKRVRAGRIALILVAIGFLALLLVAPLAMILIQALAKGVSVFIGSFADPDTIAAIKLTLLTAAIVVPVNTVFGICAAGWVAYRATEALEQAERHARQLADDLDERRRLALAERQKAERRVLTLEEEVRSLHHDLAHARRRPTGTH